MWVVFITTDCLEFIIQGQNYLTRPFWIESPKQKQDKLKSFQCFIHSFLGPLHFRMERVSAGEGGRASSPSLPTLAFSAITPNMRAPPESQKDNIKNKSSLHVISRQSISYFTTIILTRKQKLKSDWVPPRITELGSSTHFTTRTQIFLVQKFLLELWTLHLPWDSRTCWMCVGTVHDREAQVHKWEQVGWEWAGQGG